MTKTREWFGPKRKTDKVSIVGFASTSRDQAPYDDDSWEIWGMNNLFKFAKLQTHWDRWFEMHDPEKISTYYVSHWAEYQKFMKEFTGPIYMHRRMEEFPRSVELDLDKIRNLAKAGDESKRKYFCSTPSYAIALALHLGFKEIRIYGIDMVGDEEYGYQRPNMEYWIGVAEGMGVKFFIPDTSALCSSSGLYGFEGDLTQYALRQRALKERRIALEQQKAQHDVDNLNGIKVINQMEGIISVLRQMPEAIFKPLREKGKSVLEQVEKETQEQLDKVGADYGKATQENAIVNKLISMVEGALQENAHWIGRGRGELRGGSILINDGSSPEDHEQMEKDVDMALEEMPELPEEAKLMHGVQR